MKKLRIALIGCGRISACYANAFPKLSDIAEFVCAIDTDIEKARAFAAPFGAAYGTGFEDLQEKGIDVVHLCLPHYLHAPWQSAPCRQECMSLRKNRWPSRFRTRIL